MSEPAPTQHVISQALGTWIRQSPCALGRHRHLEQEPGRQSRPLRLSAPQLHWGAVSGLSFRG